MGAGGSKQNQGRAADNIEKDAYDDVHVSDDVLQRFRGTLLPRYYQPSAELQQQPPQTSTSPKSPLNSPSTEAIKETKEFEKAANKENEVLRSSLKQMEARTQRLKEDLTRSKGEVDTLRERIGQLETKLFQSAVGAPQIEDKTIEKGIQHQTDNDYYRRKLDELLSNQDQIRQQKAKELRENVDRLQKRLVADQVFKDGICSEEEAKLFKCYLDNRKSSLKCRILGEQFTKCVDEYRSRMRVPEDVSRKQQA